MNESGFGLIVRKAQEWGSLSPTAWKQTLIALAVIGLLYGILSRRVHIGGTIQVDNNLELVTEKSADALDKMNGKTAKSAMQSLPKTNAKSLSRK